MIQGMALSRDACQAGQKTFYTVIDVEISVFVVIFHKTSGGVMCLKWPMLQKYMKTAQLR